MVAIECRDRACDSPRQERDDGHGRDREERREQPQPDEPAAEVHDEPGEEEVQRRAAALGLHRVKEPAERVPPDEERQRLVLVRWPGGEPHEQEDGDGRCEPADSRPEPFPAGLDRRDRVCAGMWCGPGRRHLTRLRRQGREATTRSVF